MLLQTEIGPLKRRVQIFDMRDLDLLHFNIETSIMGFAFISEEGEIHVEWGHARIFVGSFLEILFCPKRYYKKFGRSLADLSLLKEKKRLMGGGGFFFNVRTKELYATAVGLVPREEVSEEALETRRTAFQKILENFDRLALKIGAVVGIAATDHIPAEKMARFGWRPHRHKSLRESLRHRWIWFPVPVWHFYSKEYRPSDPGV